MKSQRMKRSGLFYNYLISYILLLLIPLSAFGAALYKSYSDTFKKEMEDYVSSKLVQAMDIFERQLQNLRKTSVNISFNKDIYPYITGSNDYWNSNELNALKQYLSDRVIYNEIVDEIYLYLKDKNAFITSRGKMSGDTLFNVILKISEEDAGLFLADRNSLKQPAMLKIPRENQGTEAQYPYGIFKDTESEYTFLSFPASMYSFPQEEDDSYGTVYFKINCSKLKDIFKASLGNMDGEIYIFNDRFERVTYYGSGDRKLVDGEQLRQMVQYPEENLQNTMDDKEISIITMQSEDSLYRYIAVIDTKGYLSREGKMPAKLLAFLLLAVLCGVVMAVVLAFKNYKPIRLLMNRIRNNDFAGEPRARKRYEFDVIETSVVNMLQENLQLADKLSFQKPYVEDQVVSMLIKGTLTNKDDISRLLSKHNINMQEKYFMIAKVSICRENGQPQGIPLRELIFHINFFLEHNFYGNFYTLEMLYGDTVIVFNAKYEVLHKENMRKLVTELELYLYDYLQVNINTGVGRVYGDSTEINLSFNEAVSAFEYSLVKGKETILFYEDLIDSNSRIYWYPTDEQTRLVQFLKQGDTEVFKDITVKIFESIRSKQLSSGLIRAICFGIINSVISVVNELESEEFTAEIEALTNYKTLDDLHCSLDKVALCICQYINGKKLCGNDDLKNAILDFVNINYKNSMLSLEMLSDKFHVSAKYISRIFKEHTVCRFADYVWQLRLGHAKKLLGETELPVKEIVFAVGYSDAANFIRSFKMSEGITPGEYRKLKS